MYRRWLRTRYATRETSAKNSRFYQMSPEERLASLLNEGQISADTKKNLKIRLYLRRLPII